MLNKTAAISRFDNAFDVSTMQTPLRFMSLITPYCITQAFAAQGEQNGYNQGVTPRLFVVYVLPVIVWMLFIFGWSTDAGSAENTRSVLERLLSALPVVRDLPHEQILAIDYGIRKAAHITEYAILAVLAYRAIRRERRTFRDVDVWGVMLLCIAYAATDEFHQTFTQTREGVPADVLYDTFGAMVGTVTNLWVQARRTK